MNENGSLYIMAGSTEMGQGVTTTLPQIAAQALSMDLEKVFSEADNKSKCPWSPFFGRTFKGWPVMTVVRGEIVFKDGEVVGACGYGQYVGRSKG